MAADRLERIMNLVTLHIENALGKYPPEFSWSMAEAWMRQAAWEMKNRG